MVRANGKVALITGVSEGGIGHALAFGLMDAGYTVYGSVRKAGKEGGEYRRRGGKILTFDVLDRPAIEAAKDVLVSEAGRLDLLINNAGAAGMHLLLDVSQSEVSKIFSTNVLGVINCTQVFGRVMAVQGSGTIVNVGSVVGHTNLPGEALYNASKAAVINLSHTARIELAPLGIKVVSLEPALVRTLIAENSTEFDASGPGARMYDKKTLKESMDILHQKMDTSGPTAMPVSTFVAKVIPQITRADPPSVVCEGSGSATFKYLVPFLPSAVKAFLWADYVKWGRVKGRKAGGGHQ